MIRCVEGIEMQDTKKISGRPGSPFPGIDNFLLLSGEKNTKIAHMKNFPLIVLGSLLICSFTGSDNTGSDKDPVTSSSAIGNSPGAGKTRGWTSLFNGKD